MSIKDITVIITSFRSGKKINNCLNSINREIKVLLVENSNDSNIKNNIEKEFSNVECILTGANFGYGKSNNIGLKRVTTKYALILPLRAQQLLHCNISLPMATFSDSLIIKELN